ncbi:MAG: dipicolinate synthase [Clostridia bacterium]|nr:dipicolinate synthase [Clostridia bacterium]
MKQRSFSLAVLGGDRRQISMIEALRERGFDVRAWGLPPDCALSECWADALNGCDAVVLPLPFSFDGVHVNTTPADALRLDTLLSHMPQGLLLGGKLTERFKAHAAEKDIRCIDYFDSEVLQLKNALPSAEGALSVAMQNLPVTLDGCTAVVIGFGRIGELLARKLNALGADVTVFARRDEVLARAELAHCHTVKLACQSGVSTLEEIAPSARVVFNTVPEWVLTRRVLDRISKRCLLIDLASAPGGIDLGAAHELGLQTIWATALPGKYAPESAGIYLAQTIEAILSKPDISDRT